jgi:hypothetical protein
MTILGLGKGGCAIADLFSQYPEYKVFKADTGLKGKNCFNIPTCKTIEDYEEKLPEFKTLAKLKGETLFVLCGGGNVSGASLRLLEQVKHTDITVLYIRPDPNLISAEIAIKDRAIFGILQEFTRSGLFKKMLLISNPQVENLLGGLSIMEYYDSLNKVIVSTIHMVNYLLTAKDVFGKISAERDVDRISTVGILNVEDGTENYLYNLASARQKVFLYAVKQDDLTTNKELIKMIQQQTRNSYSGTELDISYKITTTNYESNFVYIISNTNIIQE